MTKLKNAPHLKDQPKEPMTEQIILVGAGAWNAYGKDGDGAGWRTLANRIKTDWTQKPVIIGDSQLAEINRLRLARPEQQVIGLYQFGELTQAQITALCANIAQHTQANTVAHYDNVGQLQENLSGYIARTRSGDSVAELVAENVTQSGNGSKTEPYIEKRTENGMTGLYYVTPKIDKDTGELVHNAKWLSDYAEVIGTGKSETDAYIILTFTAENETTPKIEAVPLASIGERDGWRLLRQKWLKLTNDNRLKNILADHLQRSGNRQSWTITHRTGWQNGAYILPNGEIIGEPEKPVLFCGKSASFSGYDSKGTIEQWRAEIGAYIANNPAMMIAVASAFAAPILDIIQADSFGIHLYGGSSTGKTTTANIAGSIYGHPEKTRLTWYGTAYGILNEAQAHNDGFLLLDEIGQGASVKDVSSTAYALFNGVGKIQGAKDGGNRDLMRWRTIALSTGEKDIETFLTSGGLTVKAGQLVRLLNIPIRKASHFGKFKNGKAHADHLNQATAKQYGTLGRAWIKLIQGAENEINSIHRTIKTKWAERVPENADAQIYRVADRFAILETALHLSSPLTGFSPQQYQEALTISFCDWLGIYGTRSKEEEQILEQVTGFLQRYTSRFIEFPFNPTQHTPHDTAGYLMLETEQNKDLKYFIFPQVYKNEVIKGFSDKQANEILFLSGMLERTKEAKPSYTQKTPQAIDKNRPRVYIIRPLKEEN